MDLNQLPSDTRRGELYATYQGGIDFQVQIFGMDDVANDSLQSLPNVGNLLRANIVHSYVDVHRMAVHDRGYRTGRFNFFLNSKLLRLNKHLDSPINYTKLAWKSFKSKNSSLRSCP